MELNQFYSSGFIIIVILVVFFIVDGNRRRIEKEIKKLQENLKIGDKVITTAGLSGIVEEIFEDRVILKTYPDKIKISIEKWAITELDDRYIEKTKEKKEE